MTLDDLELIWTKSRLELSWPPLPNWPVLTCKTEKRSNDDLPDVVESFLTGLGALGRRPLARKSAKRVINWLRDMAGVILARRNG